MKTRKFNWEKNVQQFAEITHKQRTIMKKYLASKDFKKNFPPQEKLIYHLALNALEVLDYLLAELLSWNSGD